MSPVDQTRMSRDVWIGKTRREPACFQPTVAPPRGVLHAAEDRGSSFFHQRLAPPPELAPFVQHFWFVLWDLRDDKPSRAETFPHPNCYLVFEHDLERGVDDPSVLRRAEVSGVTTGKFSRSMEGYGRVFGLKFQPGGLRPFFHTSASVLTNRVVHASEVFGPDILALAKQVRCLDSPEEMAAATAAYFAPKAFDLCRGCLGSTWAHLPSGLFADFGCMSCWNVFIRAKRWTVLNSRLSSDMPTRHT